MFSSVEEASLDFGEFTELSEDDFEYGRRLPYGMQQRVGAGREDLDKYFDKMEDEFNKKKKVHGRDPLAPAAPRRNEQDLGMRSNKKMGESYAMKSKKKQPKDGSISAKSTSEDLSRKKHQKKKQKKSKGEKKKKASKKFSKILIFRPETRKAATRNDPAVLEANWPTLDVLVIFQLFIAFVFLLYAIISAALGNGSDSWAYFFFALMLFVTSAPSFVLIAKSAVESAIVVYSVLQLVAAFFGYLCVTAYFIKGSEEEEEGKNTLGNNLILLLLINLQLFTTFLINWKPYKRVNLKKVRAAFADLKDGNGGKAAADEEAQQHQQYQEGSGISSAVTSTTTTKSDYRFYN